MMHGNVNFSLLIFCCLLQIKESVQFSALINQLPYLVEVSCNPATRLPSKIHYRIAFIKRKAHFCESSCVLGGAFHSICHKIHNPVQFLNANGHVPGASFFNHRDKLRLGTHCLRDPSQDLTDDPLPKWALCPPGIPVATLYLAPHLRSTIRITNPYISWEPFHARLVASSPATLAAAAAIRVDPARGVLAPRGGANNACDPTKPYPDSCALALALASPPPGPAAAIAAEEDGAEALHLVVCLEQCSWTWEVRVTAAAAAAAADWPRPMPSPHLPL
jgi:hypothetical protein